MIIRTALLSSGMACWMLVAAVAASANPAADSKRFFLLSKEAKTSQERLGYLDQSIKAKKTFTAYYMKGRVHQQLQASKEALQAFQNAERLAANKKAEALAKARKAETLGVLGYKAQASALSQEAMRLHPNPPGWLKTIGAKYSNHQASEVEIAQVLSGKGISVEGVQLDPVSEKPRWNFRVNFATNSDQLSADAFMEVQRMARILSSTEGEAGELFLIVGHTDLRGDEYYNMSLSIKRARTVLNTLTALQPSLRGRLEVEGKGEYEPLDPAKNTEAYYLNRRVEVISSR